MHQSGNVSWPQQSLCSNPAVQALLCYDTSALPAEGKLTSALPILHRLCATTNGLSAGGTCTSSECHDCAATSMCAQNQGADGSSRYFISVYIISAVFLWQFASELDADTLFESMKTAKSRSTKGRVYRQLTTTSDATDSKDDVDTLSMLSIGHHM